METSSISEIKKELKNRPSAELIEIILQLSKFKKNNKELTHYLLFEAADEQEYIRKVKQQIRLRFDEMPVSSLFFTTKYIRKTLRITTQFARYSTHKTTETELLIYFCQCLIETRYWWQNYQPIIGILTRTKEKVTKDIRKLHEDLQYDFGKMLEELSV